MGWAIMFLVLIALVIILSISLINWKIQIYKVIVQLNAILNRKTKKLVTVSLSDRRLEHLVEIINQIVSKDNIYLGEIQKKENELKENISCLSHDLRTEEYSKLLERFYVADVSRSNGTSGQGLYIVKKLLLMMNCTNPIIEIHDHNFMITIDFSPLLIKK